MVTQWQGQPKRWRVLGKAADGLVVTLGRYDTEKEAVADCEKLIQEGHYCDVRVEPVKPAPDARQPSSGT